MRILIGTPIHISKDYCLERWLENVAKLQQQTPADLLLVDNSSGPVRGNPPKADADHAFQAGRTSNGIEYVEKVKEYCAKYGIKNYKIEHFEIDDKNLNSAWSKSQRVEIAQEMIRRAALKGDYDAWFSWECDQIIPANALNKLIGLMEMGNYMMVVANSWARTIPNTFNANMGCTLISKEALKLGWFLPDKGGQISFDVSDCYNVDETMFKKRILKSGGNYIEVFGIIEPIYHLDR